MNRLFRVSLTVAEPRDLPETEPDYSLDWKVTPADPLADKPTLHASVTFSASSPAQALVEATKDIYQGFSDGPMGSTVLLGCEEVGA